MKIKESKIVQFVGAKAQDGKWRWSTITETTYNSRNFQFIIFSFLTLSLPTKEVFPVNGQNWQVANLPVVDFRFQPPEMPIPKPLNTKLSVFLFVDWFSFSSWKSWTLLSFSVLAATIRESSDKLPCIENRESFTVHSSSWPSGTKGERPVSSWLIKSDASEKYRIFSRVLLRLFSGLEILVWHHNLYDNQYYYHQYHFIIDFQVCSAHRRPKLQLWDDHLAQ